MNRIEDLTRLLRRIDGRGYKTYGEIKGIWEYPDFTLLVEHVQADPFAFPTRVRLLLPASETGIPEDLCSDPSRRIGIASYLARRFSAIAARRASRRGSGHSGKIHMESPGQEVLPQTALRVSRDGAIEARFTMGLPAHGRRVRGEEAADLFSKDLPQVVNGSLASDAWNDAELTLHARMNEDADHLRATVVERNWIGFVADGSVLPRASGADDRPAEGPEVVPFEAPETMSAEVELPFLGRIRGMPIPAGITLITGGGYHGKSTLLRALERGVYNHRPGDGRELVVSDPDSVKIRAEDGRAIHRVDISPFISDLPTGTDTSAFSTANASGSTSQAASTVEAIELGASVLLIDEDTAATNFMVRDRRMQALVPKSAEPITPFVDRVRELHDRCGVSAVLVMGGTGDYLDEADTVIGMRDYRAHDWTERSRSVTAEFPTVRNREVATPLKRPKGRIPDVRSLDPRKGRKPVKVGLRGEAIVFGTETVPLTGVEQVVSPSQKRALAHGLLLFRMRASRRPDASIRELLVEVAELLDSEGLDALTSPLRFGDLSAFRPYELGMILNRLRMFEVRPEISDRERPSSTEDVD